MCWFSHVDGKYGHVSLAFVGHSVQLGFGCARPINLLFNFMYCEQQNLTVCVI